MALLDISHFGQSLHPWSVKAGIECSWESEEDCMQALDAVETANRELRDAIARKPSTLLEPSICSIALQMNEILSSMYNRMLTMSSGGRVRRVASAVGLAVHGLAFELFDGARIGKFLRANGSETSLGDEDLFALGAEWHSLKPGEYLVKVSGFNNGQRTYLAHTLTLHLSTGRELEFRSDNNQLRAESFEFKAREGHEIVELKFCFGGCADIEQVPFALWGAKRGIIKRRLQDLRPNVLELLAVAAQIRGHTSSERKYALLLADWMGFGDLDFIRVIKGFHDSEDFKTDTIPKYWNVAVGPTKFVVDTDDHEAIQKLMDASFQKVYSRDRKKEKVPDGLKLEKAFRIQNALSWASFATTLQAVQQDLDGVQDAFYVPDIITRGKLPGGTKFDLHEGSNCAWLFHGTHPEAVDKIVQGFFRIEKGGVRDGMLFGLGLYLAESCAKSDEYSEESQDGSGLRCLLLCRTVLGNVKYCDDIAPDTTELVEACLRGPFHSVLGDRQKVHGTFREFIVYNAGQVYPEYILWYRRIYNSR